MCLWLFNVKKGLLTCIYIYFVASFTFGVLVWFTMTLSHPSRKIVVLMSSFLPRLHTGSCWPVAELGFGEPRQQPDRVVWSLPHILHCPGPSWNQTHYQVGCYVFLFCFHPSLINSPWCDLCIWLAIKCQLLQNCCWKTSLMRNQPDEKPPWWHITLI